jgi:hypothetical protein
MLCGTDAQSEASRPLHAGGRTIGRNRDYRDTGGDPVSCVCAGARAGAADAVPVERAATRACACKPTCKTTRRRSCHPPTTPCRLTFLSASGRGLSSPMCATRGFSSAPARSGRASRPTGRSAGWVRLATRRQRRMTRRSGRASPRLSTWRRWRSLPARRCSATPPAVRPPRSIAAMCSTRMWARRTRATRASARRWSPTATWCAS